jgi:Fe(3+) dicitrate transport protein
VELPTINVLGDDTQEAMFEIPGSSTLITKETLEKTKPLSVQDALSKTPGIHAVDTDGYGFYPRISIRGIGSDMSQKVLLLEDGSPIALGPYTDPAAYYSTPIERVERIEVLKGSGSIANGPSNIGGVINYITKEPRDGSSLTLAAGNLGYKSILGEYGVTSDTASFSISALKKEGDGWRDMPFDVTDVVAKGAVALNDKNTLGVKVTHYEQEAAHTYLGLTQREYSEDYKQNKAKNDRMFINRDSIDVTHQYFSDSGMEVKTLFYYNQTDRNWWRQNYEPNPLTGYNDMLNTTEGRLRSFEVMGIDSRALFDYTVSDIKNSAQAGIKLHTETMKNKRGQSSEVHTYTIDTSIQGGSYINGVREDDTRKADAITAFAENKTYIGENTTISVGARVEKYKQTREINSWGSDGTPSSNTNDNVEVIPGIGMTYVFSPKINLFAGVHKGFAPPRVADAISQEGDAVELEAEISTNYELGLRGSLEKAHYEVTLFRLDFENQIAPSSFSGGQLANAGETLNQGVELSGIYDFTQNISINGNYTYLATADITSNNQNREGNRLSYTPEHLLNLVLNYKTDSWGMGTGYSYVSEQYTDFDETKDGSADGLKGLIPSYGTWNVNAWMTINKNAQLNFVVDNVFDKQYIASRAPGGINPGMGTNAQLSLKVSF